MSNEEIETTMNKIETIKSKTLIVLYMFQVEIFMLKSNP